jgi:hypothetical protein
LKSRLNNAPHVLPEKGMEGLFLHVPSVHETHSDSKQQLLKHHIALLE